MGMFSVRPLGTELHARDWGTEFCIFVEFAFRSYMGLLVSTLAKSGGCLVEAPL